MIMAMEAAAVASEPAQEKIPQWETKTGFCSLSWAHTR